MSVRVAPTAGSWLSFTLGGDVVTLVPGHVREHLARRSPRLRSAPVYQGQSDREDDEREAERASLAGATFICFFKHLQGRTFLSTFFCLQGLQGFSSLGLASCIIFLHRKDVG